jgi:hypothetical protein
VEEEEEEGKLIWVGGWISLVIRGCLVCVKGSSWVGAGLGNRHGGGGKAWVAPRVAVAPSHARQLDGVWAGATRAAN